MVTLKICINGFLYQKWPYIPLTHIFDLLIKRQATICYIGGYLTIKSLHSKNPRASTHNLCDMNNLNT